MTGLTSQEREDIANEIQILAELERRESQRKFYRLFPDEDTVQADGSVIHSREKYPRHMEFFRVGAEYRQRCFMAGNRCITPWTWVETAFGLAPSAEAWTSTDLPVLAWDGVSRCVALSTGAFLRGIEQAFRLVMADGQFLDCSGRHQVLSAEGWISLDQLVSLSSGLRLWHRRKDYQASCAADGYLDDQPPQFLGGTDLAPPPSPTGAPEPARLIFSLPDEAARELRYIRACPRLDRLATRDDLRRLAALFGRFSAAATGKPVLSLKGSTQEYLRLAAELAPHPQSSAGRQIDRSPLDASREPGQTRSPDGSCRPTAQYVTRRSGARWCDAQPRGGSIQEWFDDEAHIPIFVPSSAPVLVGGQVVAAIVPLGLQPIIDVHVPFYNNYIAGGVVNHNCGKTVAGAYEISCHLSGQYPPWWEGRRFDTPTRVWAAGKTNETTRDIVQKELLGDVRRGQPKRFTGTGLIPGDLIGEVAWKQGVNDLSDTVKVRHVSGQWSMLGLKSYQQGRGSFEGTAQHAILFDEEPPIDVYDEAVIRTASTNGVIMLTFTPLEGLSDTVKQFMPGEMRPDG